MYNKRVFSCIGLLLLFNPACNAAEPSTNSLPEPLTLELALKLVDQQHPNLRAANAAIDSARAGLQQAESNDDFTASLNAEARWIKPATISPDQQNEDHRLEFSINKTLYDFGRSSAQIDMAGQNVLSQDLQYRNAEQQQYLTIMKRYFDVVLADLQFYRYNEEMAVAYIQYDKIKTRQGLGQTTDIDVAEKEVEYQRIRGLRTQSQNQQRVTRSLLAQALNHPDNLPDTVARPKLDVLSRKLPEVEELQKAALENNPVLGALRAQLQAAKNSMDAARAGNSPTLSGALEAYDYARKTASSDQWRARIILNVPLWSGNRVDAAVARAKADVYKLEADLANQENRLKQRVLELWMKIETLRINHDEMKAAMNYAELTLDKNRALYELEVQADLGDSMVKYSAAERNLVNNDFSIALAFAQLDALSGTLLNKNNEHNLIK